VIAFKGFTKELTATLGQGVFQFEPGKTYTEERSKCASGGFHCAEYPFDCFSYYRLDGKNRFFMVEAEGSLDEDDKGSRIACTRITLLEELTARRLAYHGMEYMIKHPARAWEMHSYNVQAAAETAEMTEGLNGPAIVIARGKHPAVKGPAGSVLGLLLEPEQGDFRAARLFSVDGVKWRPDTWYTVDGTGMIVEAGER